MRRRRAGRAEPVRARWVLLHAGDDVVDLIERPLGQGVAGVRQAQRRVGDAVGDRVVERRVACLVPPFRPVTPLVAVTRPPPARSLPCYPRRYDRQHAPGAGRHRQRSTRSSTRPRQTLTRRLGLHRRRLRDRDDRCGAIGSRSIRWRFARGSLRDVSNMDPSSTLLGAAAADPGRCSRRSAAARRSVGEGALASARAGERFGVRR